MNTGGMAAPESIASTAVPMNAYGKPGLSLQQQQQQQHQQGGSDQGSAGFPEMDDPTGDDALGSSRSGRACHYTQHQPIAEFLYQLTKMLTDDNDEVIEWEQGRIKVHHPERLEGEILHKYFRHSKFSSFQRQLNYFGFRKIAGKGKMSPCSYVNDAATSDIRSLLLIKRKTNGSAARKAAMAQRSQVPSSSSSHQQHHDILSATGAASQALDLMASQLSSASNNPFAVSQLQQQQQQQQQHQQQQQLVQAGYNPFATNASQSAAAAAVAASLFQPQNNALNLPNFGQQLAQLQQMKPPDSLAAGNFLNAEKALALLLAGAGQAAAAAAVSQQQQPQQQQQNQLQQQNQQQQLSPFGDLTTLNGFKSVMPSLDQLNAQLLSLVSRQQNLNSANATAAANFSTLQNMAAAAAAASNNPALAASAALASMQQQHQNQQQQQQQNQQQQQLQQQYQQQYQQLQQQQYQQEQIQQQQAAAASQDQNSATGAATAAAAASAAASMPATAAMNAAVAAAAAGQVNNLFEIPNLKSLVNEAANPSNAATSAAAAAAAAGPYGASSLAASRSFLGTRLPSSNTIFPDQSTASLGNLLTSSNRLSSLLSLGSFLSRDPSMADLLILPNNNNNNNSSSSANNNTSAHSGLSGFEFAHRGGGGGNNNNNEGKSPY